MAKFWADGFWAARFWASSFWQGLTSGRGRRLYPTTGVRYRGPATGVRVRLSNTGVDE